MTDLTIAAGGRWRLFPWVARLGFLLALIALVLLALVPAGWRAGLWAYRVSLLTLMPWTAYTAIAAAAVSALALLGWSKLRAGGRVLALLGLVGGVGVFYVPWHFTRLASSVPRMHDITTNSIDPPAFEAVLPARAAENAVSADYALANEALQRGGYPDIGPLFTTLPPAEAFKRALAAAQAMQGWRIVATGTDRIEASQTSFWMGFTDDIVIRVRAEGPTTRIDIRSESRQGMSDLGVNATRVRAYLDTLHDLLE